jgi:hypothetical protein
MSDWKVTVTWPNGESIIQTIVAPSQPAAERAARKLAIGRRPYNGQPSKVTSEPV